jgi:radical SAM superfamily enzyme YgiQ (UPF0313 family)
MPRLLLINPSNKQKGLGNIKATAWPPLNLPYIAALTPDHYDIALIDENIEPFAGKAADLVGITAYTSSVSRGYEIARFYKDRKIPVVMGGIHVSMLPDEALRFCDAVVIGEAESVWGQVIQDFENRCLKPKYQGQLLELAQLPIPRRDILKNAYYRWGSIQTSRGCPMNCDFCSVTAFNGNRFRRRPVRAVIEELQSIPQRLVLLVDDNIVGYGKKEAQWAKQFFSEIIRQRIRKIFFAQVSLNFGEDPALVQLAQRAGLRVVLVGMESINPRTLKAYNKQLNLKRLEEDGYHHLIHVIRRSGIALLGAFMLGSDADTPAIFPATLEFIRQTGVDIVQLTKPTPLPGTRYWDALNRAHRITRAHFPDDWNAYRLTKLVFEPQRMTRKEVYRGFTQMRMAYYRPAATIRRTLRTLRDTRSLTATLLAYKFNASYRKAFFQSDHYQRYKNAGIITKTTMPGCSCAS